MTNITSVSCFVGAPPGQMSKGPIPNGPPAAPHAGGYGPQGDGQMGPPRYVSPAVRVERRNLFL